MKCIINNCDKLGNNQFLGCSLLRYINTSEIGTNLTYIQTNLADLSREYRVYNFQKQTLISTS